MSDLYDTVLEMVVTYQFLPNQRINEVHLARKLKTSRTPVREVLNRLHAQGFLQFKKGSGFSCREFSPREIQELYQLRSIIETAAIRLACENATHTEVKALETFLQQTGPEPGDRSSRELVELDQHFHEQLMQLARNDEMLKVLSNINARIRFFRWVDMDNKRGDTQIEHQQIIQALIERDADKAAGLVQTHIHRRLDEIIQAVKAGREIMNAQQTDTNHDATRSR